MRRAAGLSMSAKIARARVPGVSPKRSGCGASSIQRPSALISASRRTRAGKKAAISCARNAPNECPTMSIGPSSPSAVSRSSWCSVISVTFS